MGLLVRWIRGVPSSLPDPCILAVAFNVPGMALTSCLLAKRAEPEKLIKQLSRVFRGAIVAVYSANRGKVAHIPRVLSTRQPLFSHISLHKALIQPLQQDVLGQVDADEHHLADALFPFRPLWSQIAAHQLVHALEDHLAIRSLHI